jgi:phage shock protein E
MKKKLLNSLVLFLIITGLFSCQTGTKQEEVNNTTETKTIAKLVNLNPAAFAERMAAKDDYVLLDVRSVAEFQSGHIQGAINADVNTAAFAAAIKDLDKTKPVLLYCAVGGRSSYAARLMQEQGFTELYHLSEGTSGWMRQGFALVK